MAVKIRLSRAGAKKTPHYRVIVADARNPRDGRFIERVGTYNPLLSRDHPDRVKLKLDRIQYWLDQGAQPSSRVAKFLGSADVIPVRKRENPEKAKPKAKAQARLDELAKIEAEKAEEASKGATESAEPVDEPVAEESQESEKSEEMPDEAAGSGAPIEKPEVEESGEAREPEVKT